MAHTVAFRPPSQFSSCLSTIVCLGYPKTSLLCMSATCWSPVTFVSFIPLYSLIHWTLNVLIFLTRRAKMNLWLLDVQGERRRQAASQQTKRMIGTQLIPLLMRVRAIHGWNNRNHLENERQITKPFVTLCESERGIRWHNQKMEKEKLVFLPVISFHQSRALYLGKITRDIILNLWLTYLFGSK